MGLGGVGETVRALDDEPDEEGEDGDEAEEPLQRPAIATAGHSTARPTPVALETVHLRTPENRLVIPDHRAVYMGSELP